MAGMRLCSVYIRAALAILAATAITVYCVWLIQSVAIRTFESSTAGRVVRQFEYVAPQMQQRDKEVEELTRP